MSVTPNANNLYMKLHYTSVGLTHVHSINLNSTSPASPGDNPTIVALSGAAQNIPYDVFFQAYIDVITPMFLSTDSFGLFELFARTGGTTLTPIRTDSVSEVGTHSGASTQRAESQTTVTLRDNLFKQAKFEFFGCEEGGLVKHSTIPANATGDYVNELLDATGFHMGTYIRSRSGSQLTAFLSYVIQANNHSEKRLLY